MYNTPEFTANIKSMVESDSGDLIIRGFANTTAKDRAGDVIPFTTWNTSSALTNFMKNPILLAFHDHSIPIGEITNIQVTPEGLEVEARVVKSAPQNIYGLIKEGILKAFSVGFRILDAEFVSEPVNNTELFVIKDLELLEISVVSVPCNQDSIFSLQKSLNSVDYSELKKKFTPVDSGSETSEVVKFLKVLQSL